MQNSHGKTNTDVSLGRARRRHKAGLRPKLKTPHVPRECLGRVCSPFVVAPAAPNVGGGVGNDQWEEVPTTPFLPAEPE